MSLQMKQGYFANSGNNLFTAIENGTSLKQNYYALATYNNSFIETNFSEFKNHYHRLSNLRDKYLENSDDFHRANNLINDLKTKCAKHWEELQKQSKNPVSILAAAAV